MVAVVLSEVCGSKRMIEVTVMRGGKEGRGARSVGSCSLRRKVVCCANPKKRGCGQGFGRRLRSKVAVSRICVRGSPVLGLRGVPQGFL